MDRPLHPMEPLAPGDWYACMEPERPVSRVHTVYEERCPKCCLKAAVDLAQGGDFLLRDISEGEPPMLLSAIAAGEGLVSP